MSPTAFRERLTRPVTAKQVAVATGSLITGLLGAWALAKPTVVYVDHRYVHASTYDSAQIIQQGKRAIDSLKHDDEIRRIAAEMASIDTGVRCLRKALPEMVCRK